jgi:hypothetical protein
MEIGWRGTPGKSLTKTWKLAPAELSYSPKVPRSSHKILQTANLHRKGIAQDDNKRSPRRSRNGPSLWSVVFVFGGIRSFPPFEG